MENIKIVKVDGNNKDFYYLSKKLEDFQFNLMPVLKTQGYSLTDDFSGIIGFVMYDSKKPIGSIGLKKVNDETCEIVRVYVSDEYRGKGLAKMLFENIEHLAKELGYKYAEMVAWGFATSALKLYEKLNYKFSPQKESEWFAGLKYVELRKILK